jgi:hypothetical protein
MTMQHPELYPSTQRGATRQKRRLPALIPILKGLMDSVDNPHSPEDRASVKAQFLQFINSAAGTQYHETVFLYWFDNHYRHGLLDYPEPDKEISARAERKQTAQVEKEKTVAEMKQKVEKAVEQKAQIILLDWVLPNGKALKDCTGRDCQRMSRSVGAWLQKVAERVKPTELVGNVLQEADVRKLLPQALSELAK